MSKASRRSQREAAKEQIKERKRAQRLLRQRQKAEGLCAPVEVSLPNRKCQYKTGEEERAARVDATVEQIKVFRAHLPTLLNRLSEIPDPRDPKKIKHKLTVVMIYGILSFVFQMASRREANRQMTRPVFMGNLRLVFPELESLPHHDTLNRLVSEMEVEKIEEAHVELIRRLMRKKKFNRYLIANCYPIAIDGTQKFRRDSCWAEECLERQVGKARQYYVYVLEANLAFHNGMVMPLLSEFLSYGEGDAELEKQDCERRAFRRLAKRLKEYFPRLPVMVLLDGLYPNGPMMALCRAYNWQYMMVLQDTVLPSVWEEVYGLRELEQGNERRQRWGNRRQYFWWVNDIEYCYDRRRQLVHVVVCEESWEEVGKDGRIEQRSSKHAWISSEPLSATNVHERCNLGARHRWGIESGILVEKRHGYQYEHCFSYNWNAMRGYHYLMRLGHALNVLARYSTALTKIVQDLGVRGFIRFVRETIAGPWLDPKEVQARLMAPFQLRLQ